MKAAYTTRPQNIQNRPVFVSLFALALLVFVAGNIAGQTQAIAVLIGGLAGFSLYHASFGFTAAWRRIFAEGRGVGLRYQFLLIVLTCAVSFPLIAYTDARGFILPVSMGMLFGSFLFGFGMQFGGGCGSGTLFVAGGGSTRMCITLLFFVIGSVIGTAHLHWWNAIAFPDFVQTVFGIGDKFSYGMIKNLSPAFAFIVLAMILASIAIWSVWYEKRLHGDLEPPRRTLSFIRGPWSPLAGAIALAIVGVLTLVVAGRPWGVTWAFALWGAKGADLIGFDVLSWPFWTGWKANAIENSVFRDTTSVMNFGIIAGALAAAGLAARFKPVWALSRIEISTAIFGGLLMGYGARLAYGCNIGAYLGGLVSGSAHGWAWALMAFAGSSLAVMAKRRLDYETVPGGLNMRNLVAGIAIVSGVISIGLAGAFAGTEKSLKRVGWITHETNIPYKQLYPRLKVAIKKSGLRHITTASASAGAKGRGLTIRGNRVVGIYNNFFAVRMLEASIAAGMEAPIRMYLTERTDGGSNLSYKTPTFAFTPYFEEGGKPLRDMAAELDELFVQIAADTINN